jgi:glycyl-tRNA synthetase beta chain
MGELLLELLSEEIPARMQRRAIEDVVNRLGEWLQAHRIRGGEPIRGYVTPRRLTVIANGIPERLLHQREEKRGPRVDAPQAAIDGFLRSVGIETIEDCEVRDTGRGEFYFAVIERADRGTSEVLPDLIYSTIAGVAWPKSMRFPASRLHWVRPLVSIICLFNGEIVPLALDEVPVGRTTLGHRFLSEGEIAVDNAADYLGKLETAHVVLDQNRRRSLIAADLDRLAAAVGLRVKPDPALLDEVAGLVEFPVVLIGAIDADFVRPLPDGLPPEVLASAMRTHQKYFSCLKPDGTLASRFLFVANNLTPDDGWTIVAGNERVLRARLADARFFWNKDRKVRLADRDEALKQRVYYDRLGTMFDKTERMERLAEFLVEHVPGASKTEAMRAARLAKADLSTGMVGEFPELQGVIGRYYALSYWEDPRVADAIADHYKPLGPNDTCPTAPISIVVALADKLDSLAGFFTIGEPPTGSRDPFALRRAALGTIRLILENGLRLPLGHCFASAVVNLGSGILENAPEQGSVKDLLLAFIADRLKVHLREQQVRHDLIAAVFAVDEDDLVRLLARVAALIMFLDSEDGANLLIAYRRAANIVSIEERRDKRRYDDENDDPVALVAPEEVELSRALGQIGGRVGDHIRKDNFEVAMAALATLRQPVDEFFDKVTVNTDDRALRENRLRLLSRIRAVMNQVADFSQVEG